MRLYDYYPSCFRAALGGNALVSWYNAMNDPSSSLWRIGRTEYGGTLLWFMGFVGAVIVLDVILNDWTPDTFRFGKYDLKIRWKRSFEHRHWLFVGLAVCYAGQPYVAAVAGSGVSLELYFYWYALTNIAVSFLDAAQRSRSRGWETAYS